ncbi:Crp/Fnr family transcriptional regulator [Danxiaibacter flavus]|uniref:Crp/Fnr family transcriptional regulator n=1 Tax=Danxiaibacter flavus TaxID=3049108 RepID=A0ABV3ZDX6_9BACT|nr:Crp/Fnr family transcriptional regulator [Chitinophagaceae bacterium DXS]
MQDVLCDVTSCFLCTNCIPEWREIIAMKKQTRLFKKNESIFSEGDDVKGIYFIYSGAVKIHKQWSDEKDMIIRFSSAGDILGHRGLGGANKYPVSATALDTTKACFITNQFLETLLRSNHDLTYKLMHFYASELQKAEQRMRNLAHMDVKGRIAETLLDLKKVFGLNDDGFIGVVITRQDIASYAGTTYETVFKLFNDLTSEGVIVTEGKSIRVINEEKLRKMVG